MKKRKAVITNRLEKFNGNYRKEDKLWKGYKVLDNEFNEIVDCRIYYPNQVAYCAIWFHGNNVWKQGTGKAGGYGYCKGSASVGSAIRNSGIDLAYNISGVGFEVVKEALLDCAKLFTTKKKLHIVEFYG